MNYFTVSTQHLSIYREKGSKFIAIIEPVTNSIEIDACLKKIRATYPDATHHCYAIRINPLELLEISQDDGEPNGTAGLPILNALRSSTFINSLIVVVRYYGGTKLGKSGLIQAYATAANQVIAESVKYELILYTEFELYFNYDQTKLIDHVMNNYQGFFSATKYLEQVHASVRVPQNLSIDFELALRDLEWTGIHFNKLRDILDRKIVQ